MFKLIIKLFFVVFIVYPYASYSQWKIHSEQNKFEVKNDFLENTPTETLKEGYVFFRPLWSPNDNVITHGLKILGDLNEFNLPIDVKSHIVKKFPLDIHVDSIKIPNILLNYHIKNVTNLYILLKTQSEYYLYDLKGLDDGYNVPSVINLTEFRNFEGTNFSGSQIISDLIIIGIPKTPEHYSSELVIAELKLFFVNSFMKKAEGVFFSELQGDRVVNIEDFIQEEFGSNYPIQRLTHFKEFVPTIDYWFTLADSVSNDQKKEETLKLIEKIFRKYPYKQLRGFKESDFDKKIREIRNKNGDFEDQISAFQNLALELNDGHFHLEVENKREKLGAIVFKELGDKIVVVGKFNDDIPVDLGAELLKVNGTPLSEYIDSLSTFYYGNRLNRRRMAISKLAYGEVGVSKTFSFKSYENEELIQINYDEKLKVPDNFKPIHGKFETMDSWSYYRLNSWNSGDWVRFYKHKDDLQKSNGIIFDLRGNPGGLEIEMLRLASVFVNGLTTSHNMSYVYGSGEEVSFSNLLKPNKYLNLSKKKVIVLVDNKTACASEIFISILKNSLGNKIRVIGASSTAGSFSNLNIFHLPFGIEFYTNVLSTPKPAENIQIELIGIEPDIYIPLVSYKDLFPYEDKVLNETLKISKLLNP